MSSTSLLSGSAAHEHPDVGGAHVGAHRPGVLGAGDDVCGEAVQFVCLGLRLGPDVFSDADEDVLHLGVAGEVVALWRRRSANTANRSPSCCSASRAASAKRRNFLTHELEQLAT
jgi:hypothetical protein